MRLIRYYRRMRTALAYTSFTAVMLICFEAGWGWFSMLAGLTAVMFVAVLTPEEQELIRDHENLKRNLKEHYQNVIILDDPWEEVR